LSFNQITGGSSGIGKYLAIECAKNGAHISLVARNPTLLEEARVEVLKFASVAEQKVSCFSGKFLWLGICMLELIQFNTQWM